MASTLVHEEVIRALGRGDDAALGESLAILRPADIAESFPLLSDEDRSRILFALPARAAAEIVVALDEAVRDEVVDEMDTASLTDLVSELQPDDAADVIGTLTQVHARDVLDGLNDAQSDQIEHLLEYGASTAGGIMTPGVIAVPSSATVADAISLVRGASPDEALHEICIVDEERRPIGTVPLRRLVTCGPDARLQTIIDPHPIVLSVHDDQETVVQLLRKYDAMSAVVVDRDGRLVGRITHDDVLDVADEEAEEDLLRLAGTDASELHTRSVMAAARIRLTWLLPCLFGMLLSATVLGLFKPRFDLALFGSLALFVPMIGAMGGNSGIQTATIIVRGFATGELASTRFSRAFLREGRIALTMAPVCGVVAWGLCSLSLPFFQSLTDGDQRNLMTGHVALAVGAAMTVAITLAGGLGIALPFAFRRLGVDPAIAAGPLVTTLNDVLSVTVYMVVAVNLMT